MTIKRKIMFILLVSLMAVSFTGCSFLLGLFGVPLNIEARILSFQNAINESNRSALNILTNFGPENDMTYYSSAKELDYWEKAFPSELQYTFLVTNSSDPAAVVVGGTKKDADGNLVAAVNYKFVMYGEENGNYLIREIYEDPDNTNTMLIRKADF